MMVLQDIGNIRIFTFLF